MPWLCKIILWYLTTRWSKKIDVSALSQNQVNCNLIPYPGYMIAGCIQHSIVIVEEKIVA